MIYRKSSIDCYSGGKVVKRFAVPKVTQNRTRWCDSSTLSVIDGDEFQGSGKLRLPRQSQPTGHESPGKR